MYSNPFCLPHKPVQPEPHEYRQLKAFPSTLSNSDTVEGEVDSFRRPMLRVTTWWMGEVTVNADNAGASLCKCRFVS